ncbi:hypothetical protein, partial [Paenibacillus sp. XY044]|uniref:hypothetical protein n=1 Tax=Paenibacillus sp. XY044 TaxID=2026089 RepID=UPI001C5330BD
RPEPGSNSPIKLEESAHPKGVAFQRKFVAHFETDEIDLISCRSGPKTIACILTRCSVFKDQTSFSLPPRVSAATLILYQVQPSFASFFLKSFFQACCPKL